MFFLVPDNNNYTTELLICQVAEKGIEPLTIAYETIELPLLHSAKVRLSGFEPPKPSA